MLEVSVVCNVVTRNTEDPIAAKRPNLISPSSAYTYLVAAMPNKTVAAIRRMLS